MDEPLPTYRDDRMIRCPGCGDWREVDAVFSRTFCADCLNDAYWHAASYGDAASWRDRFDAALARRISGDQSARTVVD